MTRCFLLNITGNPNCFWVNQRLEPNPRLHGAFASDFECEMSARYEAYAENDVPWMFFFLKDFWKQMLQIYGEHLEDVNQSQRTFERWLVLRYFSAKTKMTIEKRKW